MLTNQPLELGGQTALVTGATAGIGQAIAQKLAALGAEVIVHGRNAERGGQLVNEIQNSGGKARFLAADVSIPDEIKSLIAAASEIDILVNNAGFATWGPTKDFDISQFDQMYAGNVRATFLLVAGFAPGMVTRGKGSIVNISSMAGKIGLVNGAAYGATKAALISLTQSWAAEFGPSGVRVNAVAPGPVYTRPEAKDLFDALGATTPPETSRATRRDRRSRRLPRKPKVQLRHRCRLRRRWRSHCHLI